MTHVVHPAAVCSDCGRTADLEPHHLFGPDMWLNSWFTCGHERPWLCPGCKRKRYDERKPRACSVCGCGEVYT